MGQINNLKNSQLPALQRAVRQAGTATPLNSAAIGREGLLVYGGGVITIENGGLKVTGSIDVIGELIASGILTFSGTLTQEGESTFTGPTHFDGATDVTGDFDVDGPMTTTGTLDVEGVTTLKADLNVTAGGEINAGNIKISPSASNGGVEFVSGGGVGGIGGNVVVRGSGNAGLITDTTAALFAGASQITVGDGSVKIDGLPTITGVTANLYMDPSTKQVKRIV